MQPDQGQGSAAHDGQDGGQEGRQAVGAQYAAPAPGHNGSHPAPQASQPVGGSAAGPSERQVFRLPGAIVAWWAWIVVAVFSLIDMAVTGRNHTSAEIAVALLLVTGVMYACALRPKVVTDSEGITVHNPLRDHRIPWGSVTSIDLAESVRVHADRGPGAKRKVIHTWALYAQRRSRIRTEMMRQSPRRLPRSPFSADSSSTSSDSKVPTAQIMANQLDELARDARQRGAPGGLPVATWSWWSVAGIIVPAVALVLVITVTH